MSERHFRSTMAAALLALAVVISGQPVSAHDAKYHVVPENPPELSFGRSENYDYDPPAPGSYELPAIKPAADGRVLDARGRSRSLHEVFGDHLTVMAFIYTRCSDPKGCPLSLGLLYDLLEVGRADPAIGDNLRLVALSFDHAHDTPEVLARLSGTSGPAADTEPGVIYLTTESQADLDPILDAYDQPIGRKADADDPFGPFTHQLRVYLIDREKTIRNIYSLGFLDPRLVVTDLRTLLLEEVGGAPGQ